LHGDLSQNAKYQAIIVKSEQRMGEYCGAVGFGLVGIIAAIGACDTGAKGFVLPQVELDAPQKMPMRHSLTSKLPVT
jgi:hypothetical protein